MGTGLKTRHYKEEMPAAKGHGSKDPPLQGGDAGYERARV
jgi:hypothetical protein